MRQLFAKRPQPYYIYAPDYRRSSAGIRVMHMLCDALVRSGHEAYINARVQNPELMTPLLTDDVISLHKAQGVEPIVVYPEVVNGNPLNATTVVRYLLNKPGFVEGSGVYADTDLLFAYTQGLLQDGMPEDRVLHLPATDTSIFRLPTEPEKRVPGKVCYYQGRRGQAKVDPQLLPDDAVEITPSFPESWEALADLFQQCEFLYLGEQSGLAAEAALCGCVSVVLPGQWAPDNFSLHEYKNYGTAWGTDAQEIERARQTLPLLREQMEHHQSRFWAYLDRFIEITQQAANEHKAQVGRRQLEPWMAERVPSESQHRLISEHLATHREPVIGVVVLDREGDQERLIKTIKSLSSEGQNYASVRILALTTGSVPATQANDKLRFFALDTDNVSASINQVLADEQVDWFMLVDAGCEFTDSGLMIAALDLLAAPQCRAVYGDEIVRAEGGEIGPNLRPDINLDLLLSLPNAMARHWLFNRDTWLTMQGFDTNAGRAFELDYILRLVEAAGFEGLGHISEPLLFEDAQPLFDCEHELAVITRHIQSRGYANGSVSSRRPGRYEIDYGVPSGAKVSILLELDGTKVAHAQRCVESILAKTTYPYYEVVLLVREGAVAGLKDWLEGIEQLGTDALRVLWFAPTKSSASIRNQAAEQVQGDFLLWLDEGTAALQADWLQQMLNHASRHEVGAVSALLINGEKKVVDAGLIMGLKGPMNTAFDGFSWDNPGYLQRLQVDQNYVALSGKCMLMRKALFLEAGGFDETEQLQPWSAADLCMKLHAAGYLNVFTPRAQLMITEGVKKTVTEAEQNAIYARWLPLLARDPSHNINFSPSTDAALGLAPSKLTWRPLSSWQPIPTVLAHAADNFGCGHYRVIQPLAALNKTAMVEGTLAWNHLSVIELERYKPDTIVLQRQVSDAQIKHLGRMQQFSQAFKVFELDDYLPNLPVKSVHRADMPKDVVRSIRRALSHVDRFVVSTDALAEAFAGFHDDIRVVHNRLDVSWWGNLQSNRRRQKKPRVGWAGGSSHTGDLEMIADVVKELANEVEWVFFGMCPEKLRPYVQEFHSGVEISQYPAKLASLDLDLALAPVEQNLFNECKSNLRLLEYGACGFPVVCSDVRCYQGYDELPVTRVKPRFRDWVDAIRMHLSDLDATAKQGDALKRAVRKDWMLEGDNLELWRRAWTPS